MGYKTEQFVGKVDDHLICVLCQEVLQDPWGCKDGHAFCKECITVWLKTNQKCPLDNKPLQVINLVHNLIAKNMIDNLDVYCHPPENDRKIAAREELDSTSYQVSKYCTMGYRPELFVGEVDTNLICSICYEVFEDPVNCKNGHTFCCTCIQRWLRQQNRCPLDNALIFEDSLSRNFALKGVIDNMEVRCNPAVSRGEPRCIWRGKLDQLRAHKERCPFQEVRCIHEGCKQMIKRRELEDHDEICGFKMVECEECRLDMMRQGLEEHIQYDCPEVLLPCPNKCTNAQGGIENIKRKVIEDHLANVCAKTEVACPFVTQGCSSFVAREDVAKHMQENMAWHMILLAKQNDLLNERCLSLENQNEHLTELNELLRKDLGDIKDDLSSYIWTIDDYPSQSNKQSFRSPSFWLCGYSWYLKVYPKGDKDSQGFLTLKLFMNTDDGAKLRPQAVVPSGHVSVSYRLSVISQTSDTGDATSGKKIIFSKLHTIQRESFMLKEEDLFEKYCDSKNNSLIIKCTIHVCL